MILEIVGDLHKLIEIEQQWLDKLNCKDDDDCYNIQIKAGSTNEGIPMSEEQKQKLSKMLSGKKRTKETKEKISVASKNRPPISEETRKKMSDAHKGFKHTEESKRKISENQKGKIVSQEARENMRKSHLGKKLPQSVKMKIGEKNKGSKHNMAKLDEEKVLEIKRMLKEGKSCASIGRLFGVTPEMISLIKHNKNWTHVKLKEDK